MLHHGTQHPLFQDRHSLVLDMRTCLGEILQMWLWIGWVALFVRLTETVFCCRVICIKYQRWRQHHSCPLSHAVHYDALFNNFAHWPTLGLAVILMGLHRWHGKRRFYSSTCSFFKHGLFTWTVVGVRHVALVLNVHCLIRQYSCRFTLKKPARPSQNNSHLKHKRLVCKEWMMKYIVIPRLICG